MEAIERDFSAKEWETLDAQPFAIDENFTAVLDGYGDLFAYVLKIEGQFDPELLEMFLEWAENADIPGRPTPQRQAIFASSASA